MQKLLIITCIFLFSLIGWRVGQHYSFTTAYFLSFAGSLAGVFIGWWVWRHFLD